MKLGEIAPLVAPNRIAISLFSQSRITIQNIEYWVFAIIFGATVKTIKFTLKQNWVFVLFRQFLAGREKWLYLVKMFYWKAKQNPWGVCRHKAGEQRICVCEGKSVLVTITVMPFPDRRWSTSLQHRVISLHAMHFQTRQQRSWISLCFLFKHPLFSTAWSFPHPPKAVWKV